jgi:sugar/nucleoside kinase (ribokinase family)
VRELIAEVDAGIIFANEAEQAAAGVLHAPIAVVKRGAAGCTVYEQGTRRDVAAPLVEHVVDTTGAGDAFAAGWLVGGLQLALETARRSVGVRGAMPPKD